MTAVVCVKWWGGHLRLSGRPVINTTTEGLWKQQAVGMDKLKPWEPAAGTGNHNFLHNTQSENMPTNHSAEFLNSAL